MAKKLTPDSYHWYRRYPTRALAGMRGLNPEQKGVYGVIIDLCYEARGPLADDDMTMARACDCDVRRYRRIKAELLAKGRIVTDAEAGTLYDDKAIRELVQAEIYSQSQAERARRKPVSKPVDKVVRLALVAGDRAYDRPELGHMISPKSPTVSLISLKENGAKREEKKEESSLVKKARPPSAAQPPRGGGARAPLRQMSPAERMAEIERFRAALGAEQEGKDGGSDGGSGATIGDGKAARRKRLPGVGN